MLVEFALVVTRMCMSVKFMRWTEDLCKLKLLELNHIFFICMQHSLSG